MYYVFLNKISPPVAVKARIDIIFDGKNILNWKMSDLNLSVHTSFKTIFLICEGTSNITWLYLRMLQNWGLPQRLFTHTYFFRGVIVGGYFLYKLWLVQDDTSRQQSFGAETLTSSLFFRTLFNQPHSLSRVFSICWQISQPTSPRQVRVRVPDHSVVVVRLVGLMVADFHIYRICCSGQAALQILLT